MTDSAPVTTEYVTREEFDAAREQTDAFMQEVRESLSNLSEQISALDNRFGDVDDKVERSRRDSIDEMAQLVEDKIGHERRQRQNEVEELTSRVDNISERMSHQLDSITSKIDSIGGDLNHMSGQLANWKSVLENREESFAQREQRLEKFIVKEAAQQRGKTRQLDDAINSMVAERERDRDRLSTLHQTVMGDGEGGRPSLYMLTERTATQMNTGFRQVDQRLGDVLTQVREHEDTIETLKDFMEREDNKWQRRRETAVNVVSGLLEKQWVVMGLFGIALAIIVAIAPDAADFVREVFRTINVNANQP